MTDLSPDDRGFTLGHGLFETLLVRYGEPMFWDQHLDRLAAACSRIGLPPPDRAEVRNGAESAWRPALYTSTNISSVLPWPVLVSQRNW